MRMFHTEVYVVFGLVFLVNASDGASVGRNAETTQSPVTERSGAQTDAKEAFKDVVIRLCQKAYTDLETYPGTDLPFLDKNCSILCVYGKPEVPIPDGDPCYLKLNFYGTPGTCFEGECVIKGRPFEFTREADDVLDDMDMLES